MRKLLLVLLLFIISLIGLWVAFNTFTLRSRQSNIPLATQLPSYPRAAEHLLEAVRLRTTQDSLGQGELPRLHRWIQHTYPRLFQHPNINWQFLGEHTWVMKWTGHLPDQAPIVLVASPEVAAPNTEQLPEWNYDPFLGKRDSLHLYGQGVQGSKAAMVALLEVLDSLVAVLPTPARTLYVALPFPATTGTATLLRALEQAGVQPAYLLQPGGGIHQAGWSSIQAPIACIGVGQLAGADYPLIRSDSGTPWASALAPIRNALERVDHTHPTAAAFLADLVPEFSATDRLFFANHWLLSLRKGAYFQDSSLLQSNLGGQLQLLYAPRQDTATLRLYALDASQLPSSAALHSAIGEHGFAVLPPTQQWPSRTTASADHRLYQQLSNTCKEIFPDLLTAPTWVPAAPELTVLPLSTPLYQFHPIVYTPSTWQAAQRGVPEVIRATSYQQWLQFYQRLLVNAM